MIMILFGALSLKVSGILNNFYINIVRHVTGKERDGLDINDLADFQSNEQILEQIKEKYSADPGIKKTKWLIVV